jgi:hypothetical protein
MKSVSIRKLSLMGLVLLGASAVTAAIIPSKKKELNIRFCNGRPQHFSTGCRFDVQDTCITASSNFNCMRQQVMVPILLQQPQVPGAPHIQVAP